MSKKFQEKSFIKFLIIAFGQFVSLLGSGLSNFALGIWLFETTGKATYFALTITVYFLPIFLFSPFAGSLADRKSRKKIIILTDTLDALLKILMAGLFFTGNMKIWLVYPLIFLSSTLGAFQGPSFRASIPFLVEKEKMSKAHGVLQLANSAEGMLSPILGVALYSLIGLEGIFALDFLSYFVAVSTIFAFKIPQPEFAKQIGKSFTNTVISDFKFVFNYLLNEKRDLLYLALCSTTFTLIGSHGMTLFPPMVLSMFDNATYGIISSIQGGAMVLSSFLITLLPDNKHKVRTIFLIDTLAGVGFMTIGFFRSWEIMALGISIFIFAIPSVRVLNATLIQTKADKEILGRISGFITVLGISPVIFTSIASGPLADYIMEPLLSKNGALANTFIGEFIGVGQGRGIALTFFILGTLMVLFFSSMLIFNKRLLTMEERLPDKI